MGSYPTFFPGEVRVYVPVFSAVMTDAGESDNKDVRQSSDKSITIHGNKVFWCAFGHPYRQFAFQEKYKWDIIKQNIDKKPGSEKIPLKPLIRSFLVEEHVVKDIMLKATTEAFSEIAADHDINVDKRATNQFGISDNSKRKLEMAALPGSLITYADFEDLEEFDKYTEVTKEWGEIKTIGELKQKFNLPTEVFTPPDSSFFITTDKNNVAKIANYEDVEANIRKEETINGRKVNSKWKEYASVLEKMNNVPELTDANQLTMLKLQTSPISEYKLDFTDNTVKNYMIKQNLNSQHLADAKRLLDSFELLKVMTKRPKLPWFLLVSPVDLKVTGYSELRQIILKQCTNIIAGKHDSQSIEVLQTEMKNNNIRWKFSPSVDNYQENINSAVDFLKRKGQLADFPSGEKFTKKGLADYYKVSLKNYVLSAKCKLSNDDKIFIKQTIDGSITERNIVYTTEENSGFKIFLGADVSKRQVIMPDDQLSIEMFEKDISGDQIKNHLSKVVERTSFISPPRKVTLIFPDSDLGTATEHLWKKRATELGDYLKSSMEVQNIELKFRQSKSFKYDMISHTIDSGQRKELPVRLVNGHLIIDGHIAPLEVVKEIQNIYDNLRDGDSFRSLLKSKQSDIVFVPSTEGFFLSNTHQDRVSKSRLLVDYENKQFKKPIRNEIIIALDQDKSTADNNQKHVPSAADEAADMLYDGFRHKRKDSVMLVSASKENNRWNINKILPIHSETGIGTFDDVRITVVGKGHSSSKPGVFEIAGQNSKGINDLIQEIKTTFDIREDAVQKVSVVACNPETKTTKPKDVVTRAIKLGKDIAEKNKVDVSTRVGYVKVDEEGHKWFSATEDGEYHRRQYGDVYIAEWDGEKVISGESKVSVQAEEFLKDTDIKRSDHLGVSKTVSNELGSDIFKNGLFLQEEIKSNIRSQNLNAETSQPQGKTVFDNPKMQKRLQKLGNVMSKYGMLQTASFLLNAEKCKKTNYSSEEVCEARKSIAAISLTQEVTELASSAASKSLRGGTPKVKIAPKPGTASIKSFGKSLMRNPLKGLPLLGLGLDGISLGLDIYDLTRAKTPTEKGIAGTSVALSGLSFIAGATALGASILGFTAVAAVAGPAAIVVGALAFLFNIGVTIWQTIVYEKTHIPLVNNSSKKFETWHSMYDQQWYECKESAVFFKPGVAVKLLSFTSDTIQANSEYLCETKRKNWKLHARIYPLLLGSQICEDYDSLESNCYCHELGCSGLINIRSGMNIGGTQQFACSNFKTVILNTSPIVLYV